MRRARFTWPRHANAAEHSLTFTVNLRSTPRLATQVERILELVASQASELTVVNEWSNSVTDQQLREVGLLSAERAASCSLTGAARRHFVGLALRSRHAEAVYDGQIVLTTDDFGQTVHVAVRDELAVRVLGMIGDS